MAITKKTLFADNLDKYNTFVTDTDPLSKYFKLTELPDTFTGGKNAFLIQGSEYLVADSLIKIELKDAKGDVIYHEPGEGYFSSSISGSDNKPIITEYFEGVSKVVSVHIYPDTAFGPCTLTILGELASYDNNGTNVPIPTNWEGSYNVKWQKEINVVPSLPNTTKIRFYKRPTAKITELLEPIYRIENDLKVASAVTQSFANIKLSNLETFAGDVKRVKVFRTSVGDISDYDMIQDILVESKELLTSFGLSDSVVGNTGIFTSEVLKNQWNSGSLNATLNSTKVEAGVRLTGSGYFTYTQSLDIKTTNTYELNLDAFYSSSTSSNLGIYLSQLTSSVQEISPGVMGTVFFYVSSSIATLNGTTPTKNLLDTTIPFKIDRNYPTASLYFSQSQGEWHVGNVSLKLSEDTAFSPDEVSFITTMPTVLGNETFNFKFEFYDVNNNYVPVAVTQSATFTGGNTNIGGTILLISSSTSQSLADLNRVSQSISGTIVVTSGSVNTLSGSVSGTIGVVSGSVFTLSGSVSGTIGVLSGSVSGTIGVLSGSVSGSITSLSSSVSTSISNAKADAFARVQQLANGGLSGTFIDNNLIFSPVIGGQLGYISELFKVGTAPSIYLDARQNPRKIFIGGIVNPSDTQYNEYSGAFNNTNTNVYLDSTGKFSLGNKLSYDGSNLSVNGTITITNPSTANNGSKVGGFSNGDALTGGSIAGVTIAPTKIYIGTGTFANANTGFYVDSSGQFSLKDKLYWDGTTLNITGNLAVGSSVPSSAVSGLGSLATRNSVSKDDGITGLGGLATRDGVTTADVSGLGGLATKSTVTNTELADNAVTAGKIAAAAVTSGKIEALAVIAGKIAANAVTADEIASNSITAGKIVVGAITADRIAADTITANNISSLSFSGKTANFDTGTIGGWSMSASQLTGGSAVGGGDGSFTTSGIRLGSGGWISSQNFYIDSSGNASFRGNITATGGSFTGDISMGSGGNLIAGDVRLSSTGLGTTAGGFGSSISNYSMFTRRLRLYSNPDDDGNRQGSFADVSLQFDSLSSSSGLTTLGVDGIGNVRKVSSSRKYKKEIESLPLETAKRILDLNIVSFKDKNTEISNTPHAGLIAEEVDDLNYKDWVIYDNSGSVDGVFYQSIFASMIKVVQNLNSRIEELEAKISGSI
jgi:hypothetical protein